MAKNSRLALFKDPEVIFQLAVLGCSIFLSTVSSTYSRASRAFPQLLLYLIIILCSIYLFLRFFLPEILPYVVAPRKEEDEEALRAKKLTASRFYLGCLGFGIAIATVILFGFVFMVPVYFIFYTLFLGSKKNLIKVIITALAITLLVYLIFGYFMNIPMTSGLFFS